MTKEFKAYAKINLSLDVTERRPNGYHSIRSVMQTISLFDLIRITLTPASENLITLSCPNAADFPDIHWDRRNLIYKAADVLLLMNSEKSETHFNVHIETTKNIPSGAGLAGGSADAAATLRGLNEMLELGLSERALCDVGVTLGADLPFCITGGTVLCEGIGELLTKLPACPNFDVVLLKPEASIATGPTYNEVDAHILSAPHPNVDEMVLAIKKGHRDLIPDLLGNFLELGAMPQCSQIETLKNSLSSMGADGVLMSGSGSTVFGLFNNRQLAEKAYNSFILQKYPGVRVFLTEFVNP